MAFLPALLLGLMGKQSYDAGRQQAKDRRRYEAEEADAKMWRDKQRAQQEAQWNAPKDFMTFAQNTPGMPGYLPPPAVPPTMTPQTGRYPQGMMPGAAAPTLPAPSPFGTEEEALKALMGSGLSPYALDYGANLLKMGLPSQDEQRMNEIVTRPDGTKVPRWQLNESLTLNPLPAPGRPLSAAELTLYRKSLIQLGQAKDEAEAATILPDGATEYVLKALGLLRMAVDDTTNPPGTGTGSRRTNTPGPSIAEVAGMVPPSLGAEGMEPTTPPALPMPAQPLQTMPPPMPTDLRLPTPDLRTLSRSRLPDDGTVPGMTSLPTGESTLPMNTGIQPPMTNDAQDMQALVNQTIKNGIWRPYEELKGTLENLETAKKLYGDPRSESVLQFDANGMPVGVLTDAEGQPVFLTPEQSKFQQQMQLKRTPDAPSDEAKRTVSVWSFNSFPGAQKKEDKVGGRVWYEGTMTTPGGAMPGGVYNIDTRPQPFTYANGRTVYKTPSEVEAIKGGLDLKNKDEQLRIQQANLALNRQAERRLQDALGLDQKRYSDARRAAADTATQRKLDRIANLSKDWRVEKTTTQDIGGKSYTVGTGQWTWKPGTPESVKSEVLRLGNETKGELYDEYMDIGKQSGLTGKALTEYVNEQMKKLGYE